MKIKTKILCTLLAMSLLVVPDRLGKLFVNMATRAEKLGKIIYTVFARINFHGDVPALDFEGFFGDRITKGKFGSRFQTDPYRNLAINKWSGRRDLNPHCFVESISLLGRL